MNKNKILETFNKYWWGAESKWHDRYCSFLCKDDGICDCNLEENKKIIEGLFEGECKYCRGQGTYDFASNGNITTCGFCDGSGKVKSDSERVVEEGRNVTPESTKSRSFQSKIPEKLPSSKKIDTINEGFELSFNKINEIIDYLKGKEC